MFSALRFGVATSTSSSSSSSSSGDSSSSILLLERRGWERRAKVGLGRAIWTSA